MDQNEEKEFNLSYINVLIVDDNPGVLVSAGHVLGQVFTVFSILDPKETMDAIKKHDIDVVLLDINMPNCSGDEVLAIIQESVPFVAVIMFSSVADTASVVRFIRAGAYSYFVKDGLNMDALIEMIKKAAADFSKPKRVSSYQIPAKFTGFVSQHPLMKGIYKDALNVAATDQLNVLILGETGVGKEYLAQFIHCHSWRRNNPFVAVNCGAIPSNLVETELFGHEAGAFTDAYEQKKGKFELANGGTLFLDEIGSMSLQNQVTLLRIIQERVVERIGGTSPIPVDVRVVAATNLDLAEAVSEGVFRQDLFYRIGGVSFTIPPVRDRREDVSHMLRYLLSKYCNRLMIPVKQLSLDVFTLLSMYDWPGNFREMNSFVERLVALSSSSRSIQIKDLPSKCVSTGFISYKSMRQYPKSKRKHIVKSIYRLMGENMSATAKLLDVNRSTLYRLLA